MDSEDYINIRDNKRARNKKHLRHGTEEIELLNTVFSGHLDIVKINDYQFRINGTLDLYPTNKKYHNIKTQERGTYKSVQDMIKKFFYNLQ